jgi:uncharacterized protein DUF3224
MLQQCFSALILITALGPFAGGQAAKPIQTPAADTAQKESAMTHHAKGTFEVKVVPQADDRAGDQSLGRLTIDKQFHGDLEGTGVGQMLSGGNAATGSGGYVAMEKVTGTLQGKSGSFILQHSGTMDKGAYELNVSVVPGSGKGELKGIAGKLTIKIAEGKHLYEFDYTLSDSH